MENSDRERMATCPKFLDIGAFLKFTWLQKYFQLPFTSSAMGGPGRVWVADWLATSQSSQTQQLQSVCFTPVSTSHHSNIFKKSPNIFLTYSWSKVTKRQNLCACAVKAPWILVKDSNNKVSSVIQVCAVFVQILYNVALNIMVLVSLPVSLAEWLKIKLLKKWIKLKIIKMRFEALLIKL